MGPPKHKTIEFVHFKWYIGRHVNHHSIKLFEKIENWLLLKLEWEVVGNENILLSYNIPAHVVITQSPEGLLCMKNWWSGERGVKNFIQ